MKKNLPENKPTQWEIGQPSDVFSKNPVKIKIPLGLLQRGVSKNAKSVKIFRSEGETNRTEN